MAFKKQTIQQICSLLKIKEDDFNKALTDAAEIDVVIDPELQVLTKPDLEARDRNKYNDGKTAGTEMLIKEIKKKHEITIDGNDPDAVVIAIGAKAVKDAGVNPDARIADKDRLIEQWKVKNAETEKALAKSNAQANEYASNAELISVFPANRSKTLNDSEYVSLIKNNYRVEQKEGKKIVIDIATGDEMRDKTNLEPMPLKAVIENHFTTRKWIEEAAGAGAPAGGGGGSTKHELGGKGFTKMSELRTHAEANQISLTGEKFNAMVKEAVKENKDFIID